MSDVVVDAEAVAVGADVATAKPRRRLVRWELAGLDLAARLDPPEKKAIASARQRLVDVEKRLREAVAHDDPRIADMAGHLVRAGGKRVRPLLCLLCAQYGDPCAVEVRTAAVVCELTHLATLHHDDVMDQAGVRRGVPSVNHRWDDEVAVRTGDLLFARAGALAATLGPAAVAVQVETAHRLVLGQTRETVGPPPGRDPLEHYFGVVADKTGSLIAASCRLGSLLSGADPLVVEALGTFGERFGVAFQLADDLLDVLGASRVSGKKPGTDLREGVRTLPVLRLLAHAGVDDGRLVELVSGPIPDEDELAEALQLLRAHPALEIAREDVRREAVAARDWLAALPDLPSTRLLDVACGTLADRDR